MEQHRTFSSTRSFIRINFRRESGGISHVSSHTAPSRTAVYTQLHALESILWVTSLGFTSHGAHYLWAFSTEKALCRFSSVQGFEVAPGFLENLCTSDNIYTSLLLQCGLVVCVSFESPHHFTHQIRFGRIFSILMLLLLEVIVTVTGSY